MSQLRQSSPADVTEGSPPSGLTLVVLLLVPCVVVLLLLNCFFLGYKLLVVSKRRGDAEELLLMRSALQRVGRDAAFSPLREGRGPFASLSEPALHRPVTSSRASSRDRAELDHRVRLLRPDGATGSGSLRAPSTIRAASSAAGFTPRLDLPSGSRTRIASSRAAWCQSAPVLARSSDSESGETRLNLVPPNSPTQEAERAGHEMLIDVSSGAAAPAFEKAALGRQFAGPPSDASCLNTSAVGSGLDSDFGASAGVSLRILSADSDGLSNGVLTSALEWDYYDPCYVKQNNVPKHKHHRPVIHTKQYWV